MCEYCNPNGTDDLFIDDSIGVCVSLKIGTPEEKNRIAIGYSCDDYWYSFYREININYCPVCGKKLN